MPTVADCLRQHAPAYYERFGRRIPLGHRKVIDAVTRCGTGKLGHVVYECDQCGKHHHVPRSCGNRHCPECQHHKTAQWVAKQIDRLLPVHYFLVTFTVPEEVRSVLRRNQRAGYDAIFDCGSQSMIDVASETRALRGCRIGFFGVLHTWGRDPMVYHPHVHFVVPGGGVNEAESRWQATANDFFLHHGTLIRVYREKFKDEMKRLRLYDQIPRSAWRKKWVVDIEPVGDGRGAVKYLAPYVHRVAISNNRIVACDRTSVTFRYKPSEKKSFKTRKVSGLEFVRGLAQHVLPTGLKKIRYYGWMTSNSRVAREEIWDGTAVSGLDDLVGQSLAGNRRAGSAEMRLWRNAFGRRGDEFLRRARRVFGRLPGHGVKNDRYRLRTPKHSTRQREGDRGVSAPSKVIGVQNIVLGSREACQSRRKSVWRG